MRAVKYGAAGLALVAMLALGLRFYMGRAAEDAVAPAELVDIRALRPPLPGNAFLACSPGFCSVPEAAPSPVFAVGWMQLADAVRAVAAAHSRVGFMLFEPAVPRVTYVVHTPLLLFPDIVTVEFVALAPDRTGLAIYSRARYGKYDFGTNRRRVEEWLRALRQGVGRS